METHSSRKKYTLITGASAGLGKAIAKECAGRGQNMILVSLPYEGLHLFGQALEKKHNVEVHCYETDLTQPQELLRFAQWVKQNFSLNILINNAGVGGTVPIDHATPACIENILQLNIRVLSMLTYHFVPELKKHRQSHILNVGSISAFGPVPYKTVYPASKAFVNAFSYCLRAELMGSPVRVTVLNPGVMLTNSDVIARNSKQSWWGRQLNLSPEFVAKHAVDGMLRGKRAVLPGSLCKMSYWLMRLIPNVIQSFLLLRIFQKEVPAQYKNKPSDIESGWSEKPSQL